MAFADKGVAVQTGAAGRRTIIEMKELGQVRGRRCDIGMRVFAGGKHVARVDAHTETGIVDFGNKGLEGGLGAENL